MKLNDVIALGRTPVDPSYPANIAIAALALAVAIGGGNRHLLSGAELPESTLWGISAGFLPFLTRALE